MANSQTRTQEKSTLIDLPRSEPYRRGFFSNHKIYKFFKNDNSYHFGKLDSHVTLCNHVVWPFSRVMTTEL